MRISTWKHAWRRELKEGEAWILQCLMVIANKTIDRPNNYICDQEKCIFNYNGGGGLRTILKPRSQSKICRGGPANLVYLLRINSNTVSLHS